VKVNGSGKYPSFDNLAVKGSVANSKYNKTIIIYNIKGIFMICANP
jgi:hypothetical protein